MGTSQRSLITGLGYLALFVLGLAQGLIGSFQYNQSPVPLIAILLILILFATCVLAGWGLRTYAAGILPALGWIIASFVLAMPRPNGSVIIEANSAGRVVPLRRRAGGGGRRRRIVLHLDSHQVPAELAGRPRLTLGSRRPAWLSPGG